MPLTILNSAIAFPILSMTMLESPSPEFTWGNSLSLELNYMSGQGQAITLNRYPYIGDVGLTEAARKTSQTGIVGTANAIQQATEPVTLTLEEYMGPFSAIANAIAPYGVTELVAEQSMSNILSFSDPLSFSNSIGANVLKQDHDRWKDRVISERTNSAGLVNFRNPGGIADGAFTVGSYVNSLDITVAVAALRTALASPFDGGFYHGYLDAFAEKAMLNDVDFKTVASRSDATRLFNGEIGIYQGVRWFRSQNTAGRTLNGVPVSRIPILGRGALGMGSGRAVHLRKSNDNDYERFMFLLWRGLYAFATLDTRFIFELRSASN